MKPVGDMSHSELAAYVQGHLRKIGINVVLSGGSCVSIYSDNKYVSMDLDLVLISYTRWSRIQDAMHELGFHEEGRHFRHPDNRLLVEFPPGPVAIGEEAIGVVEQRRVGTGMLYLLSPTDCVKDRLASYYFWSDLQCLEQAILVTRDQEVDLKKIEQWSKAEGKAEAFKKIKKRLLNARKEKDI